MSNLSCREFLSLLKEVTLRGRDLLADDTFGKNTDQFSAIESSIDELNLITQDVKRKLRLFKVTQNFSNSVIVIDEKSPPQITKKLTSDTLNRSVESFDFDPNKLKFKSEYFELIGKKDKNTYESTSDQALIDGRFSIESSSENNIKGKSIINHMIDETIKNSSNSDIKNLMEYDACFDAFNDSNLQQSINIKTSEEAVDYLLNKPKNPSASSSKSSNTIEAKDLIEPDNIEAFLKTDLSDKSGLTEEKNSDQFFEVQSGESPETQSKESSSTQSKESSSTQLDESFESQVNESLKSQLNKSSETFEIYSNKSLSTKSDKLTKNDKMGNFTELRSNISVECVETNSDTISCKSFEQEVEKFNTLEEFFDEIKSTNSSQSDKTPDPSTLNKLQINQDFEANSIPEVINLGEKVSSQLPLNKSDKQKESLIENIEPDIISLDENKCLPLPMHESNSRNESITTLDSDNENFDLNIDFDKNQKIKKSPKHESDSKNLKKWQLDEKCQSLSEYSEEDESTMISLESKQLNAKKATSSTKRKRMPVKTRDFRLHLVKLPERLIELALKDVKKASVEIEKYESKEMAKFSKNPMLSRFKFKTVHDSTNQLPSTSSLRRKQIKIKKNIFDLFANLSEDEEDIVQPASKKQKNNKVLDSENEEENEIIKSKSSKKRKRVLSSTDEENSSFDDSFNESFNFWSNDQNESISKSKKNRYHYSDIYTSDSSFDGVTIIDDTILSDKDMCEVFKIFEKPGHKLKTERVDVEELLKQQDDEEKKKEQNLARKQKKTSSPQSTSKLKSTSQKRTFPVSHKIESGKPVGVRTAPSKENVSNETKRVIKKRQIERRESAQQILNKDLSEETEREGRMEIQRIKRIQQIADRFKDINKLYELANQKAVVLEYDKDNQPLVQIDPILAKLFKNHQKEGVRFLYLNAVESIEELKRSNGRSGFGSILGHNAGLGKTFQIISFIHCLLNSPQTQPYFRSILIVTPLNVLRNWYAEIKKWILDNNLSMHFFRFETALSFKDKIEMLKSWQEIGGIMFLSHTTFWRLIINKEVDEPDDFFALSEQLLLDPGPDLVVVDEGHVIKNKKVKLNQSLSRIRTKRRIVLSGTPLQNNLEEYYNMCQYVRANLLGTYGEFRANFQIPIEAGQDEDSTPSEVKTMHQRTSVLQKVLRRVLHRVDYNTLKKELPPKHEFVLKIRLSDIQDKLYREFKRRIENNEEDMCETVKNQKQRVNTFLRHWTFFSKVYDHPYLLKSGLTSTLKWCQEIISKESDIVKMSNKIQVFLSILKHCEKNGEKLVVFSQYPPLLDVIEEVLAKEQASRLSQNSIRNQFKKFESGIDYFRCDGSSPVELRQEYFDKFNDPIHLQTRLFLLTTRACGIGINLIGANRCIIFDASWNPWNDIQSIFRTYRYGQQKEVYIYRFISYATWEEKIYQKQVQKEWLSNRIIDDHPSKRFFNTKNKRVYYEYDPQYVENHTHIPPKDDDLLAEILKSNSKIIIDYHCHDSLLERDPDHILTEEEIREAWSQYEELKKVKDQQRTLDRENAKNSFLSTLGLFQNQFDQQVTENSNTQSNQQINSDILFNQKSSVPSTQTDSNKKSSDFALGQKSNYPPEVSQVAATLNTTQNSSQNIRKSKNSTDEKTGESSDLTTKIPERPTIGELRSLLSKPPAKRNLQSTFGNFKQPLVEKQQTTPKTKNQPEKSKQSIYTETSNLPNLTTEQFPSTIPQNNISSANISKSVYVQARGQTNNFRHQNKPQDLHYCYNSTPHNFHFQQARSQPQNSSSQVNSSFVSPIILGRSHINQPHINQPHINQPHLNQPHLNQPQMNTPHMNTPHMNRPHMNQPHMNQPHMNRSFMNQPHMSRPQWNQPHMSVPHERQPHWNHLLVNNLPPNQHFTSPPRMNQSNANQAHYIPVTSSGTVRPNIQRFFVKNSSTYSKSQNSQFHRTNQNQSNGNQQNQSQTKKSQTNQPQFQPSQTQSASKPMNQSDACNNSHQNSNTQNQNFGSIKPVASSKFDQEIKKTALVNVKQSISSKANLLEPVLPLDVCNILEDQLRSLNRRRKTAKNQLNAKQRDSDLKLIEEEEKLLKFFKENKKSLIEYFPRFKPIFNPVLSTSTLSDTLDQLD